MQARVEQVAVVLGHTKSDITPVDQAKEGAQLLVANVANGGETFAVVEHPGHLEPLFRN